MKIKDFQDAQKSTIFDKLAKRNPLCSKTNRHEWNTWRQKPFEYICTKPLMPPTLNLRSKFMAS
jgi:hypothetical protein